LTGTFRHPVAPSGCRSVPLSRAEDQCAVSEPQVREVRREQYVACHFPLQDTYSGDGTEGVP